MHWFVCFRKQKKNFKKLKEKSSQYTVGVEKKPNRIQEKNFFLPPKDEIKISSLFPFWNLET